MSLKIDYDVGFPAHPVKKYKRRKKNKNANKMHRLLADSMAKINAVIERLQEAKDVENIMLLTQVFQNLDKLKRKMGT